MKLGNVLTFVFLLLLGLLQACSEDDDKMAEPTVGGLMDFSFLTVDGDVISSESLSGQPYMLVVFNTGCKDCQKELPVVDKVYGAYRDRLQFHIVAYKEDRESVSGYWRDNDFTMPFVIPADPAVIRPLAPVGIPQIYVVSAEGQILATFNDRNMPDFNRLSEAVEACLDGQSKSADTVNVHVRLNAPFRSSSDIGDGTVIASESLISSVRLFFFNSDTKKLVAYHDIDDITPLATSVDNQYDFTYLLPAVRLPLGYYDIFAIANYNNIPDNIEYENQLLALEDSVSYTDGIMSTLSSEGAIMSSCASENLRQDFTGKVNSHVYVEVNMERVVAKVVLGKVKDVFELSHDGEVYAHVNLANYKFVNLNTRFYLFRHKARLSRFEQPAEYLLPDNFASDSGADDEYVIDPLFFRKDGSQSSFSYLSSVFNHYYSDSSMSDFAAFPSSGQYGTAYILENCAYATYQNSGALTGLVFKASVNPSCVYLYDEQQGTFIRETRPEMFAETLYLYDYKFYNSIRDVNRASGLHLDVLKRYSDDELETYGIKQVFYNMGVFETFYTYWIAHSGDSGAMRYGIVRNNFYRLMVSSIEGLGKSAVITVLGN